MALSVLALGAQGARTGHWPPALEEYGDPPAVIRPMVFGPKIIVPWGGFTSYQVNVNTQQNNILGDAANEPSLCVDPNDPHRIAVAWRQFDNVTSNFRQAGYGYTTDQGLTWTFPGKLENGVFRSDPVLGARYDGTFFYLSLLQTFYDDMWKSLDGGANWSRIAAADGGDKEWFTIDNSFSVGRGNLYQIWSTAGNNYGGRQFTRSTDGGLTWLNPLFIPTSPYWGTLDVDAAGTLYIGGWSDQGGFRVIRSSDAKSAATPTFDLTSTVNLGGSIEYGQVVNPGGLSGQMWLVADRSSPAPTDPVYALCSVNVNTSNPCDVMLSRSLNGGSSWSSPIRINDDSLNSGNYHWFGTLAVSPTGRLDAVWNDTRNDASHATSALYYAYSLDGGLHFSANIRLTPSFNQSLGYPNQNKMGDYLGVVSNDFGANIAFAATFNSEEDVYYMGIPSPVVVAPTTITVAGGTYSGGVSDLANVDSSYLTTTSQVINGSKTVSVTIDGLSPSLSPKAILFNLVGHAQFGGETGAVALYNWSTAAYESLGGTTWSTSDSTLNLLAGGTLTRFVSPTGAIRARITFLHVPVNTGRAWKLYFDQAVWHVIP